MNKGEIESFTKSFLLFFGSLSLLISVLFYINYTKDVQTLDETILYKMTLCSYDLDCEEFKLNFVSIDSNKKISKLYKDNGALKSYFPIIDSKAYLLSFELPEKIYQRYVQDIKDKLYFDLFIVLVIVLILSIVFSIYALYPLRNALLLTQEFIKDILHDFNTPISTLRLNTSMLKKELTYNEKIERIELSVKNILDLQEHLRSYLQNSSVQKEEFFLDSLIQERIALIEKNYPDIDFMIDIKKIKIYTNKEALTRIADNLLSNAAKYNKQNGYVKVIYEDKTLKIIDSGKGIKNPKKIFDRFYKEQDRGIGIGLHIVKKLCDELKIAIKVHSSQGIGTTFELDISKLTID